MRAYRNFAAVYDRLMSDMPYDKWMRFAGECWARYGGVPRTVADLGCGTGNIAVPLATAGFAVYGIDLSADMLAIARGKWDGLREQDAGEREGAIRWLQQDMREWKLPEPVDAAICFCDCLNYLTEPDDVTKVFRRTFAGIAPGGLFLFDVHAPDQLERYDADQPFVHDEPEVAYLWTCDYDARRREIWHHLTFFVREETQADRRSGAGPLYRRFEESHVQRAYDPDWIARQLADAGFEVLHRCADFGWHEPNAESERLFYVARRPAV